ncbi:outer membrane lipoprotein LolB [Methylophilus rhizosphaerae]|uniref:Outer-membrane lipoprotein LolB n=1 Tax=Methylophilus rhizosphaerae TaxID=492660 RepID=A0A1G9A4I9_9PROT|nr:lipoprotein insertase outer membrane protein LolB [Methylophilus rhizosphaerae]SDK22299.1 outer membrane lipoprotein LolB [Methylophilus rhizosphaerae]
MVCWLLPPSPAWRKRIAACLMASVLAACSSLPTPPLSQTASPVAQQRMQRLAAVQQFSLEAKLAVQYNGKGYTARLEWQHDSEQDHMRIFSPLGQQVALIHRTAQSVTLTDQRGQQHQANDVASLTERLLGWRLPLTGLSQWILGIPHPASPFQASYLDSGNPATLVQDNWQIDYENYQAVTLNGTTEQLPHTTRLQQQDVRLKLVIQHW